jgi:predicted Rossmann fold nucleotide-binding protein DprA/Smf involved in DNA uptake
MIVEEQVGALTPDTQATLLLTASLGKGANSVAPLTPSEYNAVALALQAEGRRPAALLDLELVELMSAVSDRLDARAAKTVHADRIGRLLERGGRLAQAMERWSSTGVWVLGRADPAYPTRYKQKLGRAAPSIIYGVGPRRSLELGGLAIIGSRDPDERSVETAESVGSWAAGAGVQVVSGAARGVDSIAMVSCAERGGCALGVVAESLLKLSTKREFRSHIVDRNLTLISSFDPEAKFSVGSAMARNRWIYALADRALVVACSEGSGGTWAGALEAIKKGEKVFVALGNPERPGNEALLAHGAIAAPSDYDILWRDEALQVSQFQGAVVVSALPSPDDVYVSVLPMMLAALKMSMTAKQFAERLGLVKPQADSWLRRLVAEGHVQKQKSSYRVSERARPQLSLLSEQQP